MKKSLQDLLEESRQLIKDTKRKICRECREEKVLYQSSFCKECYLGPVAERRQKKRDETTITDAKGYRRIYVGDKLVLEHRHIMAEHLGRPLTKYETVIFLDNNKQNLDISNLALSLRGGTPFTMLKCCDCGGKNIAVEAPDE